MARVRSGARNAPRFDGQYEEGYQYRAPQEFSLTFGPWQGIMPGNMTAVGAAENEIVMPRDMLRSAKFAVVERGIVRPRYSIEGGLGSGASARQLLGVYALSLVTGMHHVVFYRLLSDDTLYVRLRSEAGATLLNTGITGITSTVYCTSWQNRIFFSNTDMVGIYTFDVTAMAVAQILFTVGSNFLFVIDNNLCEVYKATNRWEIRWSVDSLPLDFASYGAGIAQLCTADVMTVERVNDSAYIMGAVEGEMMSATGFIPAFRFDELTGFTGMPFSNCSATDGSVVYYINYQLRLSAYVLGNETTLGNGEDVLTDDVRLYYSHRLKKLSVAMDEYMLLMDTTTGIWVSGPLTNGTGRYVYMADTPDIPVAGNGDYLAAYYIIEPDEYAADVYNASPETTTPSISTGVENFDGPMMIHNIDVFLVRDENLNGRLTVSYRDIDDQLRSVTLTPDSIVDGSRRVRFWFDRTVSSIALEFRTLVPWPLDQGIMYITVYGRTLSNSTPTPL
jgi:hypothetical protein